MRPIDADLLTSKISFAGFPHIDRNGRIDKSWVYELIHSCPTVEPKKGKWVRITKDTASIQMWNCSECGRTVERATSLDPDIFFPFCHCGADMREADNDKRRSN